MKRHAGGPPDASAAKRAKTQEEVEVKLPDTYVELTTHMGSHKGKKQYQQDKPVVLNNLAALNPDLADARFAYYAVYDGHAGEFVSTYLQEHLHLTVIEQIAKDFKYSPTPAHPPQSPAVAPPPPSANACRIKQTEKKVQLQLRKSLIVSFLNTDKTIQGLCNKQETGSAGRPTWEHEDGSCAIAALVVGNVVWVCNVGDSKAVLGRFKGGELKAHPLSKDHTPLLVKERQRIESKRGTVEDGRVNGRLGVSRSFGDMPVKRYGVIAQPDITKFSISDKDQFMVLACDGLWSVFTVEECVQWVGAELAKAWELYRDEHKHKVEILVPGAVRETPLQAVTKMVTERLLREAVFARKVKDNTTVVLVVFHDEGRAEATATSGPSPAPDTASAPAEVDPKATADGKSQD
jgi:integrin-linked kinase-associated serine/threonine phosphatase 2C